MLAEVLAFYMIWIIVKSQKKHKHWYSGQAHPQQTSLASGGWLAHLQVTENGLSEMQ